MSEIRLDRARLAKARRTPQGFVRVDARLTRTGILEYRRADGSVQRELRPEDEVFRADSLASLALAPVTDLHPSEMVNATNARQLTVGTTLEPRRDGRFVAAELVVHAGDVIAKIDSGDRTEISCGYSCDYDATPGVWEGQRYDGVQRNITYNHVAIGPSNWGRAGSEVALRLDGADADALVARFDAEGDDTDFAAVETTLEGYFDDALELPAAHGALVGAGLSHFEADVLLGAHTDAADARLDFDPSQPRDERGRFTSGGGSAGTGGAKASGSAPSGDRDAARRAKALNEIKGRLAKKAEAKAKRASAKGGGKPKVDPNKVESARNAWREKVAKATAPKVAEKPAPAAKAKIAAATAPKAAASPDEHFEKTLASFPEGTRVRIADIKAKLGVSHEEANRQLLRAQASGKLVMFGIDDPLDRTPADHAAAVSVAGFQRHIVYRTPKR